MTYEITTPGRHEERICMGVQVDTLADARKQAKALAASRRKPMLIERVTKSGNSTIIERIEA